MTRRVWGHAAILPAGVDLALDTAARLSVCSSPLPTACATRVATLLRTSKTTRLPAPGKLGLKR